MNESDCRNGGIDLLGDTDENDIHENDILKVKR